MSSSPTLFPCISVLCYIARHDCSCEQSAFSMFATNCTPQFHGAHRHTTILLEHKPILLQVEANLFLGVTLVSVPRISASMNSFFWTGQAGKTYGGRLCLLITRRLYVCTFIFEVTSIVTGLLGDPYLVAQPSNVSDGPSTVVRSAAFRQVSCC